MMDNKMILELKRFHDDGDTTIGAFFIDGVFKCFIVEDQEQTKKVYGETRIPNGEFDVSLRSSGGFHNRYKTKYHSMHHGMLCVHNANDWKIIKDGITFQYVLIHTGNNDDHTAGCLLPNTSVNSALMTGSGSVVAYKKIYPIISDHLIGGGTCKIIISDIETGK